MCGRFSLAHVDAVWVKKHFNLSLDIDWPPRYNLAPNQKALTVISTEGARLIKPMTWGFAKRVINARAESVAEKPFFKKGKRCLIVADGFYEWKSKVPYRFIVKGEPNFCFAGLYDQEETFAILTTEANSLVSQVHERMPLILDEKGEQKWLDSPEVHSLLRPFPAEQMECYAVSEKVNNWRNDTPDCFKNN